MGAKATDEPTGESVGESRQRRPVPRSPLIIGGVALGLLFWMLLVVLMLIAWRLTGG